VTTPSQTEQANIEKVRAAIDAFNRRDRKAMLALGDDDFVYDWTRSLGVNARLYRGREELMEFIEDQWSIFEDQHLEVHEYIPRGNHVVVTATVHGRARQGVPVSATSAHLYTFAEDGRLVRITLFQEREEALAAAG
jgi:ketosteroid isomerase-like protein